MGIWGPGLYDNDTANDVKDDFQELYNSGKSVQNITNKLLDDYKDIFCIPDEELFFWLALADTQWDYGVLLPFIKEKAILCIDAALNFSLNQLDKNEKEDTTRILIDLKTKLNCAQPLPKKPKKRKKYTCSWKIGDVFAYRLENNLSKERGLYGRYFLIQKISECTWYPNHTIPIVYVKITTDENLPSTTAEFNQLEYVQTSFTKYEWRFFPIDGLRAEEDIANKSKLTYTVDDYGFLPEYRVKLINVPTKVLPKKLFYVGNFIDSIPPKAEFVPHTDLNIVCAQWTDEFGSAFETQMIESYFNHNRRELDIYKK